MMNETEKDFLKVYNGNSDFIHSLKNQYLYKGYLSEKQIVCLRKFMTPTQQVREYSLKVGDKVVLSKSTAMRVSEHIGGDFTHRGFEVLGVHAETERAILLDLKFTATKTVSCCVCGIKLSTDISRSIGIGPVCAEKHGIPYQLDSLGLLQAKLDTWQGTAKKVWVPKWSIKETEGGAV